MKKLTQIINKFFLLILLIYFVSCNKENVSNPDSTQIQVTKTGCKTFFSLTDSSMNDCIEYNISKGTLHVKHVNAAFNCCPDRVYVTVNISRDSIIISEKEDLLQPCHCNCLYDLEYDIPNINDSSYVIIVNEPYVTPDSNKILFYINPMLSNIGSYCVTRYQYPWQ